MNEKNVRVHTKLDADAMYVSEWFVNEFTNLVIQDVKAFREGF